MSSKTIKAKCPNCKKPLTIDYSKGDTEVICSNCQRSISVKLDENFKETKRLINNFGK